MTDKERQEDDKLKNLIHKAYNFSDEQLLEEYEDAKNSLSDSDFPGIEDRIYQKLQKRLEEEGRTEGTSETSNINNLAEASAAAAIKPSVIRFKKKKLLSVGLLAAAFVGLLGVPAVGEKNYFLRIYQGGETAKVNNSNYVKASGKLNEAYERAAEELDMPIMKLGYMPEKMEFIECGISDGIADFYFKCNKNKIHFVQEKREMDALLGQDSDRNNLINSVRNEWLQKDIDISQEKCENGEKGYSSLICIENRIYCIFRKNCASVPEERSAIPLQTEQSSAG